LITAQEVAGLNPAEVTEKKGLQKCNPFLVEHLV